MFLIIFASLFIYIIKKMWAQGRLSVDRQSPLSPNNCFIPLF